MNLLLSTLVLLAGLTQSSGSAGRFGAASHRRRAVSMSQLVASTITANEDSLIGDPFLPAQAQETRPGGPDAGPAGRERGRPHRGPDRHVPHLRQVAAARPREHRLRLREPGRCIPLFLRLSRAQGTQGLYLDGYGALFFVPVDYPLVPTEPQEPAQAKAKESADSVWSATVQEMTGQPGDQQQSARSAPAYDPQKVENLKKAAIKTLAHASNIRMRRPQDMVTLVVGDLDDRPSLGDAGASTASRLVPATGPSRNRQPASRPRPSWSCGSPRPTWMPSPRDN